MNSYFVYILECGDKSYYIGVTNDIEKRFYEHQNGLIDNCYTNDRRPVKVVFTEEFNDINQAIEREKQVKGLSRKKKEALIQNNFNALRWLSKNNQGSSSSFDRLRMT